MDFDYGNLGKQHLKEDIRRLIEALPTSCKSPRHKTRKSQVKKHEEKKIGMILGAPD
jgi:hypothetical protein